MFINPFRSQNPRASISSDLEMGLLDAAEQQDVQTSNLDKLPREIRMKIYDYAASGALAREQHQMMLLLPELATVATATRPYREIYAPVVAPFVAAGRHLADPRVSRQTCDAALDYAVLHDFDLLGAMEDTKVLRQHGLVLQDALHANNERWADTRHVARQTWRYLAIFATLPTSLLWWAVLTPSIPTLHQTFNNGVMVSMANQVGLSVCIAGAVVVAGTLVATSVDAVAATPGVISRTLVARQQRRQMQAITRPSALSRLERIPEVSERYALVQQRLAAAVDGTSPEAKEQMTVDIDALDKRIASKIAETTP